MHLKLTKIFQKVPEGYIAFVEELPGADTQGRTLKEARANLEEAISLVLEANRELAEELIQGQDVIRESIDRVPSVIRRSEPRMPRFDRSFQRKQRHDKCRPNWLSILSRDDERPRWLTKKISPAPLRLKSST